MRIFSLLSCVAVVVGLLAVGATPASAATGVATTQPALGGKPVFRGVLTVSTGTWSPAPEELRVQWLRDGTAVGKSVEARPGAKVKRRVRLKDVGRRVAARVIATYPGGVTTKETTGSVKVRKARLKLTRRAKIKGTARFGKVLKAVKPRFKPRPQRLKARWLRDGKPIKGASGKGARHRVDRKDVGHNLRVRWVAQRKGYKSARVSSTIKRAKHKVGVRRVVTYSVQTRGRIHASVKKFRKLAQRTYDDPRGWRGAGVKFRRVARGGRFTLVLAEARTVPSFSSGCSAQWSCRVGRYVVINQARWQHATPAWNGAGGSLRGYRHMVVNHETGHWLGLGHRSCPRNGAKAPVMQQQSKSLQGCRFNAFPTGAEQRAAR